MCLSIHIHPDTYTHTCAKNAHTHTLTRTHVPSHSPPDLSFSDMCVSSSQVDPLRHPRGWDLWCPCVPRPHLGSLSKARCSQNPSGSKRGTQDYHCPVVGSLPSRPRTPLLEAARCLCVGGVGNNVLLTPHTLLGAER